MRIFALRLAAVLTVASTALVAATAATAARTSSDRRVDPAAKANVEAGVRAALRAPSSTSVSAWAASELGRRAADLAPGEHPGFVWCGDDALYVWPGQVATTHDFTVYRTYLVISESGDFSDFRIEPSDFYLAQQGADYYIYDITAGEIVYGPTHFADAWLDYGLPGNTASIGFAAETIHVDGGVPGAPEYVQMEALGPSEVGSTNVCAP